MGKTVSVKNGGTGQPSLDIPAGIAEGFFVRNIFARNEDVDTPGLDTLWGGTGLWVGPTQARTHTLVSTDAADDAVTGQGAHEIRINGLLSWKDQEETTEILTMDGLTPVTTINSYVMINQIEIANHGTSGTNVGTITATADVDATVQRVMPPLTGISLDSMLAFPESFTAFITGYTCSVLTKTAGQATAFLLADFGEHLDLGANSGTVKHIVGVGSSGTSFASHGFDPYIIITGPAVISMQVESSANNMDLAGGYDAIVVRNKTIADFRAANKIK